MPHTAQRPRAASARPWRARRAPVGQRAIEGQMPSAIRSGSTPGAPARRSCRGPPADADRRRSGSAPRRVATDRNRHQRARHSRLDHVRASPTLVATHGVLRWPSPPGSVDMPRRSRAARTRRAGQQRGHVSRSPRRRTWPSSPSSRARFRQRAAARAIADQDHRHRRMPRSTQRARLQSPTWSFTIEMPTVPSTTASAGTRASDGRGPASGGRRRRRRSGSSRPCPPARRRLPPAIAADPWTRR